MTTTFRNCGAELNMGNTANTTTFCSDHSSAGATITTEAQMNLKAVDATTLSALQIYANSVTVSTGNTTHRSRNNAANGNQSVSMSTGGAFEDTTNTDAVAAGNAFSMSTTNGMSDSCIFYSVAMHHTYAGNTPLAGNGCSVTVALSTSRYASFGSGATGVGIPSSTTEADFKHRCRTAVTYSNLRISTTTYSSTSSTCRFRKNTANGNQNVAVTATGNVEDTTNTDACATGTPDVYDVLLINSSSMNSMVYSQWIVKGNQPTVPQSVYIPGLANMRWCCGSIGNAGLSNTETKTVRAQFTAKQMHYYCTTFTNSDGTQTDGRNQSVNVNASTSYFEDTTNTSVFTSGESIQPSGTGTFFTATMGACSITWDSGAYAPPLKNILQRPSNAARIGR